jgi:2-polyprenyl-3-methyl-5-hydroxy-6-metoxy-1,4-benzoquinol methylase
MNVSSCKNQILLELGCGIGTDAAYIAENSVIYQGIDLSKESLNLAVQRFKVFNLTGLFAHSSIENFDLKSSGFKTPNIVYSFGVLHHTPNPLNALKNIVSQVNVGCKFKIMLYAKNSYKMAMINSGLDQFEAQSGVHYAHTYSKEEARELMQESGLTVTNLTQDHLFMYDLHSYKNHIYQMQPWFKSMPPEIRNAFKSEFGWHLLIEATKD